jgi:hypothetical protein
MASTVTPAQLKRSEARQASKPRQMKSGAQKVEQPFDETATLQQLRDRMLQHGGKHEFEGFVD